MKIYFLIRRFSDELNDSYEKGSSPNTLVGMEKHCELLLNE